MRPIYIIAALLVMFSLCVPLAGCSQAEEGKEKSRMNDDSQLLLLDKVHRQELQKVSDWLITTGVGEYYKTRDMTLLTEYVKSKGYGWRVNPGIDEYHTHTYR